MAIMSLSLWYLNGLTVGVWSNGCVTARVGGEDEGAVTSCPAPPTNITQMLSVGEPFEEEWMLATGRDHHRP